MSGKHRYSPPSKQPHEIGRTSTGVAILLGLFVAVVGIAGIIGLILAQIMLWVIGA